MRNTLFRKSMSWFVTGSLGLGVMCGVGEVRGEEDNYIQIVMPESGFDSVCRNVAQLPTLVVSMITKKIAAQIAEKLKDKDNEGTNSVISAEITEIARNGLNIKFTVRIKAVVFGLSKDLDTFPVEIQLVVRKADNINMGVNMPSNRCYQIAFREAEAGSVDYDIIVPVQEEEERARSEENGVRSKFMTRLNQGLADGVREAMAKVAGAGQEISDELDGKKLRPHQLIIRLENKLTEPAPGGEGMAGGAPAGGDTMGESAGGAGGEPKPIGSTSTGYQPPYPAIEPPQSDAKSEEAPAGAPAPLTESASAESDPKSEEGVQKCAAQTHMCESIETYLVHCRQSQQEACRNS